jgi:hypothetical protein
MSCCGGNRARAGAPVPAAFVNATPASGGATTVAIFRYEGSGSLTVIGRATGRKYWFAANGAEVAVDRRDRPSVALVPKLRLTRTA